MKEVFSQYFTFSLPSLPSPPAILFLISGTNRPLLAAGWAEEQGRAPLAWCSTGTRAMGIELPCPGRARAISLSQPLRCALMDTGTARPLIMPFNALGASLGLAAAQDIQPLIHRGSKELHLLAQAPGTGECQVEVKASVSCPTWLCPVQEHSVRQTL